MSDDDDEVTETEPSPPEVSEPAKARIAPVLSYGYGEQIDLAELHSHLAEALGVEERHRHEVAFAIDVDGLVTILTEEPDDPDPGESLSEPDLGELHQAEQAFLRREGRYPNETERVDEALRRRDEA